ncbi:MAG: DUF6514 family protein [Eubacteriales bacterium]|nr:DUF6514 family protein [Eubacteriales bacterium]
MKDTEKNESAKLDKYTYGICACSFFNGLLDIKDCVYGISDDVDWLRSLADKLNKYDVDPIHLCDIIEDELYSVKT